MHAAGLNFAQVADALVLAAARPDPEGPERENLERLMRRIEKVEDNILMDPRCAETVSHDAKVVVKAKKAQRQAPYF